MNHAPTLIPLAAVRRRMRTAHPAGVVFAPGATDKLYTAI